MNLYLIFASLIAFLAAADANSLSYRYWQNDWDRDLNTVCDVGYGVTMVKSKHDDKKEDRRFEYICSRIANPSSTHCTRSGYVNSYDMPVFHHCPMNQFLAGAYSRHNNNKEDRIWQYRCCGSSEVVMTNCGLTGWTNSFDKEELYQVPNGYVITGVISEHSNRYDLFQAVVTRFLKKTNDMPTQPVECFIPTKSVIVKEIDDSDTSYAELNGCLDKRVQMYPNILLQFARFN